MIANTLQTSDSNVVTRDVLVTATHNTHAARCVVVVAASLAASAIMGCVAAYMLGIYSYRPENLANGVILNKWQTKLQSETKNNIQWIKVRTRDAYYMKVRDHPMYIKYANEEVATKLGKISNIAANNTEWRDTCLPADSCFNGLALY